MYPNTIINLRGTSGAGKSTLINRIMALFPHKAPVFIEGRKQPLYYLLSGLEGIPVLAIPGHYESPCGGCDTLGKYIPNIIDDDHFVSPKEGKELNSYDLIFGLVKQLYDAGYSVLFEGLLISGDVNRTKELKAAGYPINVVALNLSIDECLASVLNRRAAAGNTKPFNEENTRAKHTLLEKCLTKFEEDHLPVYRKDREGAFQIIEELLGLPLGERTA